MFQRSVSGSVSRRAFLFMPLGFLGLASAYSRMQRPEVPFRNESGTGDEVTVALFGADEHGDFAHPTSASFDVR